MASVEDLERRVACIEGRNRRVELDKSWETSLFRKVMISLFTYGVVVLFFIFAELPNPIYNSIVPTLAVLVSSLSLPYFKVVWERSRGK